MVSDFNGMKRQLGDALADKKARRNYKLVLDPVLKQGAGPDKIYRFDGVLPGVRLSAVVSGLQLQGGLMRTCA